MNAETQAKWEECFSQYRLLGLITRNILKSCAVTRLVNDGFTEVGSSDVNHELFAMWCYSKGDWQKAILFEVDNFNNA